MTLDHEGIIRIDFATLRPIHRDIIYGWIDLQVADAMNQVGITKDQFPGTTAKTIINEEEGFIEIHWKFNDSTRLNALVYTEDDRERQV